MRKADYKSTRGTYKYNVEPFPDPELLPAQGRAGPGRRVRDADPAYRLREPQGRLCRRVPDEVVDGPAVAAIAGARARAAPLFLSTGTRVTMTPALVLEQTLNGLQYGVMLFLMAAGLTLVFGIMNLVNLAHGSLYMVGAYLATAFAQWTGSFVLRRRAGPAGDAAGRHRGRDRRAPDALRARSSRPGAGHVRPHPLLQRADRDPVGPRRDLHERARRS